MTTHHEFENCYNVSAGKYKGGIYAFALSFFDKFEQLRYHRSLNAKSYENNLIDFQIWYDSFQQAKRGIKLVTLSGQTDPVETTIAAAARIDGPVSPRENTSTPVAVWTQKEGDGQWELILYCNGEQKQLRTSEQPLKNPAVCRRGQGYAVACETEVQDGGMVLVVDECGVEIGHFAGRRPILAENNGLVLILTERFADDVYELLLYAADQQDDTPAHVIRAENGWYAFNADIVTEAASKDLYIACEVSPKWGYHEGCGLYRELRVHRLRPEKASFTTVQTITHALPRQTVTDHLPQPVTPVRPRLFAGDGRVLLTYKSFALKHDHKQTGWRLWFSDITHGVEVNPELLSDQLHAMDTNYGVVLDGERVVCALPCLYQQLDWGPSVRHWLSLYEFGEPVVPPDPDKYVLKPYDLPEEFSKVGEKPERIPADDNGVLLWCDMHEHTQYSKCQSFDGAPDEKIRHQRDVLKADVLSFADHVPGMSSIEYVWTYDLLEREGGHDGLVLFCNECNAVPGRHTNYYARKRDVFDQFRCAYGSVDHPCRDLAYQFIREVLPGDEMIVLRHAHLDSTPQAMEDEETLDESFDPTLEFACEAIQTRGNALMTEILTPEKELVPFPTHYLDCGYKVGLVAGTDHSNGKPVMRYGLTGFWCRQADMASVWDALRRRKTIAVGNARISLYAHCNGIAMGETVIADKSLCFTIQVACACGVKEVGIIRNGTMIVQKAVNSCRTELDLICEHDVDESAWYIIAVTGSSAYDEPAYAHSSPFFVEPKS